jgi:SAM-dependent methyltransferase
VGDESVDLGVERAFYHRFAWAYDLLIERPAGPQVDNVAKVLCERGCAPGAHLVDAGCGTGGYAVALAVLGFNMTAVDRSAELLGEAQRRALHSGATVRFAQADLTGDWAPPAPADGVLCRGVLNDLLADGARERAFGSFARWLRPGGVLLLDVRDTERSRERYGHGRELTHAATREHDSLSFTSSTTMAADSDVLDLVERWDGRVDGHRVTHEDRFKMRTWSWSTLHDLAHTAGFTTVSRLSSETVGARGDRIVALAVR